MAKTREQIKEEVIALVKEYKDQINLSMYKRREGYKVWTDVDQMTEDLWFELFDDAVTEACGDILEDYEPEEEDDNGTW